MKRIIIVPLVGAIAALAVGSAAAISFTIGGIANIASGSEAVASCGTVNDVNYVTAFDTGDARYEITSVDVVMLAPHTCVSAAASLLTTVGAAGDLDLGTDPSVVVNTFTFAVTAPVTGTISGYPAEQLDYIAVLVQ